MSKSTQIEKIIKQMARDPERWFYAPDFQRPGMPEQDFVGYEASARMSDIMHQYPGLVDVKKEGKYRYLRLKAPAEWRNVPNNIRDLIEFEQTGQARLL